MWTRPHLMHCLPPCDFLMHGINWLSGSNHMSSAFCCVLCVQQVISHGVELCPGAGHMRACPFLALSPTRRPWNAWKHEQISGFWTVSYKILGTYKSIKFGNFHIQGIYGLTGFWWTSDDVSPWCIPYVEVLLMDLAKQAQINLGSLHSSSLSLNNWKCISPFSPNTMTS